MEKTRKVLAWGSAYVKISLSISFEHIGPLDKLFVRSILSMGSKFGFIIFRDVADAEMKLSIEKREHLEIDFLSLRQRKFFSVDVTLHSEAGISGT